MPIFRSYCNLFTDYSLALLGTKGPVGGVGGSIRCCARVDSGYSMGTISLEQLRANTVLASRFVRNLLIGVQGYRVQGYSRGFVCCCLGGGFQESFPHVSME